MFEIPKHHPISDNSNELWFWHDVVFQNSSGLRDALVKYNDEETIISVCHSTLQTRKKLGYKLHLDNKWPITFKSDTIKEITFKATAAHIAAGRGLDKVMEFLIENGHLDASGYVDYDGPCPLSLALRTGQTEVAKLLLQHKVTKKKLAPPILGLLVRDGKAEILTLLLEQNLMIPKENEHYIFEAISSFSRGTSPEDSLTTVKVLIDGGANIDAKGEMRYGTSEISRKISPLAYACSSGCFNLGLLLLEEGANPGSGEVQDSELALELLRECPLEDTHSLEIIAFAQELVRRLADPSLAKHSVRNSSDPLKILLSCQETEGGRHVVDALLRAGVVCRKENPSFSYDLVQKTVC